MYIYCICSICHKLSCVIKRCLRGRRQNSWFVWKKHKTHIAWQLSTICLSPLCSTLCGVYVIIILYIHIYLKENTTKVLVNIYIYMHTVYIQTYSIKIWIFLKTWPMKNKSWPWPAICWFCETFGWECEQRSYFWYFSKFFGDL